MQWKNKHAERYFKAARRVAMWAVEARSRHYIPRSHALLELSARWVRIAHDMEKRTRMAEVA